jgi:hypothetical protein
MPRARLLLAGLVQLMVGASSVQASIVACRYVLAPALVSAFSLDVTRESAVRRIVLVVDRRGLLGIRAMVRATRGAGAARHLAGAPIWRRRRCAVDWRRHSAALRHRLAHFANRGFTPMAATAGVLTGLMWAGVYIASRSLWVAAAHHACWNATIFLSGLPLSGQEEWRAQADVSFRARRFADGGKEDAHERRAEKVRRSHRTIGDLIY